MRSSLSDLSAIRGNQPRPAAGIDGAGNRSCGICQVICAPEHAPDRAIRRASGSWEILDLAALHARNAA
jgi:hypothetical protein